LKHILSLTHCYHNSPRGAESSTIPHTVEESTLPPIEEEQSSDLTLTNIRRASAFQESTLPSALGLSKKEAERRTIVNTRNTSLQFETGTFQSALALIFEPLHRLVAYICPLLEKLPSY
jgi:hypothetical protein